MKTVHTSDQKPPRGTTRTSNTKTKALLAKAVTAIATAEEGLTGEKQKSKDGNSGYVLDKHFGGLQLLTKGHPLGVEVAGLKVHRSRVYEYPKR